MTKEEIIEIAETIVVKKVSDGSERRTEYDYDDMPCGEYDYKFSIYHWFFEFEGQGYSGTAKYNDHNAMKQAWYKLREVCRDSGVPFLTVDAADQKMLPKLGLSL